MALPEVTYAYYAGAYGGSAIAEEDWEGYAAKAAAYLAKLGALHKVTPYGDDADDAWRDALCAVAEQHQTIDVASGAASGGAVSSASIGSVSVSYDATFGGAVDLSPAGQARMLLDAATRYLHVYAGAAQW